MDCPVAELFLTVVSVVTGFVAVFPSMVEILSCGVHGLLCTRISLKHNEAQSAREMMMMMMK